jgi:manganese/iron transport system permease protein
MMALAATFASLSGVIGLYLSYYLSIASGAAIVLTATAFFSIVFIGKRVSSTMVTGKTKTKRVNSKTFF